MTVEVQQGDLVNLDMELRNRDGDLTDGTLLTLSVVDLSDDSVVVGPVLHAGLTHLGTGLYRYAWTVPVDLGSGTYEARWDGLVEGEQIDTAIETVFVLPVEIVSAVAWPTLDELKQVVDVTSDDWEVTLERIRQAAIAKVKKDVGLWDELVDAPDDALAQAALRMAELISQRPEAAVGTITDPTYNRLLFGHRRSFGIA